MKNIVKWFAAFALVSALVGCARTVPVDNIQTVVSAGHNAQEVKNAILKAGVARKWIMSVVYPGVIKARQLSGSHSAEIIITYTATSYSIKYDSSHNLNASNGKIHRNYNRWIHNLDKQIQLNLSAGAGL